MRHRCLLVTALLTHTKDRVERVPKFAIPPKTLTFAVPSCTAATPKVFLQVPAVDASFPQGHFEVTKITKAPKEWQDSVLHS